MNGEFAGIGIRMNAAGTLNADIRDYARWEYGRNDVAWLYSVAAQRRGSAGRRPLVLGRVIRGFGRLLAVPTPENRPR